MTGLMSVAMVMSGEEVGLPVSDVEGGGGFIKFGDGDCGDGLFVSDEADVGDGGDCLMSNSEAAGGGLSISGEGVVGLCSVPSGISFSLPSSMFTIFSSSPSSFFLLSGCPIE